MGFFEKVTSEQRLMEVSNGLCEYSGEELFTQREQPVWLEQSKLGGWGEGSRRCAQR